MPKLKNLIWRHRDAYKKKYLGDNMSDSNAVDKAADDHKKLKEESIQNVKTALEKAYKSGRRSLWSFVQLGKSLIRARNIMGKDDFNKAMDFINSRQVQRYIGLVIASKSKKVYTDGNNKDLEINENIEILTEGSFNELKDPSMTKLQKCVSLSKEDFKKVMGGDDAPYDKLFKKKDPPAFTAPKDTDLTEDQYDVYKKKGTKKLVGELYKAENTIETMKKDAENSKGVLDKNLVDLEELEEDNEKLTEDLAQLQKKYDQQKETIEALNQQNALLKIKNETKEMQEEAAMAD